MGKRSNFERRERDFYPTPFEAVVPLFPHILEDQTICEPCAGDGTLVRHLMRRRRVIEAFDIEPQDSSVAKGDATKPYRTKASVIVTNPPWRRDILHRIIEVAPAPAWLLFDADWVHTKQSIPFLPRLRKIVSVGRVKWIEGSRMTGKDNCAWHLFASWGGQTEFFGRSHGLGDVGL